MRALALPALSLVLLLAGCDLFGESPEAVAARRDAEGKAVGSACRHAMRAIEDCYALNPKAPKAAVFAGWREMDEYMRENKLEGVAPTIPVKSAKEGKENKDAMGAETSAKASPPEGKPATEGKGKTAKSGSKSAKHADAAKADEAE